MVRYENGQPPSKANANLIRAADNPAFMRDCFERDGDLLSHEQRGKAEQNHLALVTSTRTGTSWILTKCTKSRCNKKC